jgi:hypothetical protein
VARVFSGIGIRILIIAVIAVGGLILRDRLSASAGDLQVGDCFDDTPGTSVDNVQHHPCSETHTAEVVLVTKYSAANGAPPLSDAELDSYIQTTCANAASGYVGSTASITSLDLLLFYPTAEDWNKGERRMICYITQPNLTPMTRSLKASTQ